jgi:hypothetical protein
VKSADLDSDLDVRKALLYNKMRYRGGVGLKKSNCCTPPPGVTWFFNIGTKTVTPGGVMQRNSFTMTSHETKNCHRCSSLDSLRTSIYLVVVLYRHKDCIQSSKS